ncbi:MAG: hypothetical protein ACT4NP_01095 [Pseudonocardiales bacterium]
MSTAALTLAAAVGRHADRWRARSRSAETCASTPDIGPALALYHLWAPCVESLQQREMRVRAGFEAGALATGCAHEVTQALPAINPTIAIDWGDAMTHQPGFATAGATPSADRAVCDGMLARVAAAGGAV